MHIESDKFLDLKQSARDIQRHIDYPEKGRLVQDCQGEIDRLYHRGEITKEMREELCILLYGSS